jgi:peptide/nickel transport system permease protein
LPGASLAVAVAAEVFTEAQLVEHRRGFRRRWYRTPSFVGGVTILGLVVLAALFAPFITQHNPTDQDLLHTLAGPSSSHWLGTDDLGRDVWSRLVYGARTTLRVAFLAVIFPFTIGTVLGLAAGYYGGWIDTVTNWLVNVVVAFPFYVLIIALVFVLGPGTRSIYIAITLVGWVSYTRIIRGEVLVAKRRDYVLAARSAGLSDRRILFRHLLPNVVTQAIVFACSDIVLDILAIVTLGYLGLGVQPPTPDWGRMIADGQTFLTTHWQLSTIPGIAIIITALGLSLLADGLADLLRPE